MKKPAIHQFHSGSAYGDAVTNSMLMIRNLLRADDIESDVFVQHVDARMRHELRPHTELKPTRQDILIVHHSMGHDLDGWLRELPMRKVIAYHNITPEQFFPPDSHEAKYVRKGRIQLTELRDIFSGAIAISSFNAQELSDAGYSDVRIVPMVCNTGDIRAAKFVIPETLRRDALNLLYVGRIVPHKRIDKLIDMTEALTRIYPGPVRMNVVGGYDPDSLVYSKIKSMIASSELDDSVILHNKVDAATMYGFYRCSDLFVSFSEHEGFGVPIVEAMALRLPVMIAPTIGMVDTLGGAGVVVEDGRPDTAAAHVAVLQEDRAWRRHIVRRQEARAEFFSLPRIRRALVEALCSVDSSLSVLLEDVAVPYSKRRRKIQVEGPFETSYSIAIVNRELACALNDQGHEVSLFATEGPGDYEPHSNDLDHVPNAVPLWKQSVRGALPDIVIRNLYPPRVVDSDGLINVLNFAWEESKVPVAWVREFNRRLDLIVVPSRFVAKALLDSGVVVPVVITGNGVGAVRPPRSPMVSADVFTFLHISSGFPRKGVDVLLAAYGEAFHATDDVRLVIKTFPNVHHNWEREIERFRALPNAPRVELINADLPETELAELYARANALIGPSRGEGFGLPFAEAMLRNLPVIVTDWGGQSDFCTDATAGLIRSDFAYSTSHVAGFDSVWMEPRVGSLVEQLLAVVSDSDEKRQRVANARSLIETRYSWQEVAKRVMNAVDVVHASSPSFAGAMRLGWVSSWNTKCGIAEYSRFLIEQALPGCIDLRILASKNDKLLGPDAANVSRCWTDYSSGDLSQLEAEVEDCDSVIIQFNFGFFQVRALGGLIRKLKARNKVVFIDFHSTKDVDKPDLKTSLREIVPELAMADRLLVHALPDLNRMKAFGLVENVSLFPHGVLRGSERSLSSARQVLGVRSTGMIIASYGFLLPHKGLDLLVEAMPDIVRRVGDVRLLMVNAKYPVAESDALAAHLKARVDALGLAKSVTMIDDFLPDDSAIALLQTADLVVYPYQETGESASGAVRFGLSSRRPVVCTPLPIFADVASVVHSLPGVSTSAISTGLSDLLLNREQREAKVELVDQWLADHEWSVTAQRLFAMLRASASSAGQSMPSPEKEQPLQSGLLSASET